MNIIDIIIKKRDGGILNKEETDFFVSSAVKGEIADYQISAMLMAIFLKGLNPHGNSTSYRRNGSFG